ncbi:MAG: O-antigen ligase family protein [Defluviitaleaceae bacterium]|nr:O-antigen ligase family protein [Defluviitaleaceae bacterium]
MNTSSVVIKKAVAFLSWLNYYFEYSLIFRAFMVVKKAAGSSAILQGFTSTEYRDYWQGSLIFKFIAFITSGIFAAIGWCVRLVVQWNKTSLNSRAFAACAAVAKRDTGFISYWNKAFYGCVPARLLRWYFGEATGALKLSYMVFLLGVLVIPSPMWNNMFLLLSAVFFAGVFLLQWFLLTGGKEKPNLAHISPALVLFVFFCSLSIVTGYGGGDSLRVFIIFFACVVHSVIVSFVFRDKNDFRLFFTMISVVLVVAALFGFYQFAMGIEIQAAFTDLGASPGLSRLYSTLGNPNNDAQFWAMLLPFVLAVAITVKNDTRRIVLIGAIFIVVAAFALTYSRAGYIALLAGIGVFVLMTAPRLVPIGLLVLILALPFIPAGILERLFTLGQDTSSQYRFLIWGGVLRMLEDFWVQGIGMGPAAFIRIYRSYAHPLAERAMHSHNMFLDLITHSGIGALLAFLAYLFRLFKRGISSHMASEDSEYKIYMAAGIAALAVFVVFGVGEYVWFYPRVMLVFWVIAGLVASMAGKNNVS